MNPAISIVIPTHNRAGLVITTIESVLAQSFTDHAILVVDDGSTDDTRDVLKPLVDAGKIQYHFQVNQGRSAARNKGLASAWGTYVMFLDSDDILVPNALDLLFNYAQADPTAGLIAGTRLLINAAGEIQPETEIINWTSMSVGKKFTVEMIDGLCFTPSAYIVKRSLAQSLSGFDKNFEPAEDYDFFVKCCQSAKIIALKETVVKMLRHDGNTDEGDLRRASLRIGQKNLENLSDLNGAHAPDVLNLIKAKWHIRIGNDHYSLAQNFYAFRNYLSAIIACPKVLLADGAGRLMRQMAASLIPAHLRGRRSRG